MKILLVPWWLLLFEVTLSLGHYIRQAKDSHSNVYEVQDGSSGVSFTNPKPEKPTLREILYYHVIERAHGEPTERSFTNGHGYQFLKEEPSNEELPHSEKHKHDGEYLSYELEEDNEKDGHYEKEDSDHDGHYEKEDSEHDGHYEKDDSENDGHYSKERNGNEGHDLGHNDDDPVSILRELLSGNLGEEENSESTTTQKPLTDEDVKEAYKTRSYLFDQMRQRYAVKRMAVPDTLNRRKRQADMQQIPEAPRTSEMSSKEAYMQPKTYGMNLNPEGGYVWNNLNNPSTYYELGNGNPNEGQYEPSQSQENIPQPTENTYIPPTQSQEFIPPAPETSDSGSSEDIFVSTNRPSAIPLVEEEPNSESSEPINENPGLIIPNPEPIINPELVNDNPEPVNDNLEPANPEPSNPEANYPVAPVIAPADSNDKSEPEGIANYPMGPEVYNPVPSYPEIPVAENPKPSDDQPAPEIPLENPVSQGPTEPVDSYENPGSNYEAQPEAPKPEYTTEENAEAEKNKEIPEAPTLPPLNYDILPSYIRDAISSTEKPASFEQTENAYFNPQPNPEDKKVMEDKMEDIFATMTPVEDIPKTYGMNLTSDGGHVWNDMVNPPVSYDIGSPSKSEEEHKENPTQEPKPKPDTEGPIINPNEPTIEPEPHESEEVKNPIEEPAEQEKEGEKEKPIANPIELSTEQPETHESEEAKNPIEKPAEPEKGGDIEEPVINQNEPNLEQPETHESEEAKNPIPEPAEPEKEGDIEEPVINPNVPNIGQPETHESEEAKNPIKEPAEPEKEDDIEEPVIIPNEPTIEQPESHETEEAKNPIEEPPVPEQENEEKKPIEKPNQPIETIEPEPENPEVEQEDHPAIEDTEIPDESEEPSEENGQDEPVEVKQECEKKSDIMSELLKSEQFWKWLGEWTATYMELLEKHIRKIAIQEICNREKAGNQMCPLDDDPEETDENDGVLIKDGKIKVDGKEIEITHTDNLDKDLKRGNHNQNNKKEDYGNKIQATTIYGNSVGNEKVTNVFIFTADKANEIVDKLKPANDSAVDFVIDDRIKEDKDENKIDKEPVKNEAPLDVEQADKVEKKPIESQLPLEVESADKVEKKPIEIQIPLEGESDDKVDKKPIENESPLGESAEDKVSNKHIENEANKEELNKEEANSEVKEDSKKEDLVTSADEDARGDEPKLDFETNASKEYLEK